MGLFSGLMPHEVTIAPFSAEAATGWRGAPTYGSVATYPARIEYKQQRVLGPDARQQLSTGRVVIEGDVSVASRDLLTLPSGFDPQTPPILAIEKNPAPFVGMAVTTIYF